MKTEFSDRIGFAVGSGRCGTHFVTQVLSREAGVSAAHERGRVNEAFRRYCLWYRLPVDPEGFLGQKEREIQEDLAEHRFSFESSSYLSLSIEELYERFDAKFILLIRRPDQVVNSFWTKGWYENRYTQVDADIALGFQPHPKDHHYFSRIAPIGKEFKSWNQMSRVGKIGWFWNAINLRAAEQFVRLPETHWRLVKLEELSFETYLEMSEFLGINSRLTEREYRQIADHRPGGRPHAYATEAWSEREAREFEEQVRPAAEHFGYEYQVRKLLLKSPSTTAKQDYGADSRLRLGWLRFGRTLSVVRGIRNRSQRADRDTHI